MERTAQPPAGTCLWSSASGRPVQSVTSEVKPCSWVCFACVKNGELYLLTDADKTTVHFNKLSDEWIWEYVRGGSPMDKAGAYGIQDGGLVEKIEGSYTNVVGFPVELVKNMLEKEWV